ncbi:MAG: hypothetical protein PHQ20_01375 [Candidatus Moranbacteria bacterium]|nr:hypothetical protein [Candidatus Moranbacteria bacterium]
MSSAIFQNISWTIEQVAAFLAEANQKPTKHRSRYYKASFFLTASAVEAIVFLLVKNFCNTNTIEYRKEYKYRHLHTLPSKLFKNFSGEQVGIYEKTKIDFKWNDTITWQSINEIGYKYNLFEKRLYNKLERIRKKRNRIHIQSLSAKDHKYTKQDIEYISSVLPQLLTICSTKHLIY